MCPSTITRYKSVTLLLQNFLCPIDNCFVITVICVEHCMSFQTALLWRCTIGVKVPEAVYIIKAKYSLVLVVEISPTSVVSEILL